MVVKAWFQTDGGPGPYSVLPKLTSHFSFGPEHWEGNELDLGLGGASWAQIDAEDERWWTDDRGHSAHDEFEQ